MMTFTTASAQSFNCTDAEAATLNTLAGLRAGGIATIHGYRPSTNYTVAPVVDSQVIIRFSTERLYARKVKALESVTFADVADAIASTPKLAALSLGEALEAFTARKAWLVEGLTGQRSNGHHAGHARCYVNVADGVKVNLVTVKDADGIMQPVIADNGLPTAASIMVSVLELSRRVVTEGVRKPAPNSGVPVLMGNAIDRVMNRRSVGYTSRTLKAGTFDRITADGRTVTAQDVVDGNAEAVMEAVAA